MDPFLQRSEFDPTDKYVETEAKNRKRVIKNENDISQNQLENNYCLFSKKAKVVCVLREAN